MSYKETRKFCKACGRVTVHWRPGTEWRETSPPVGWQVPVGALFRVICRLYPRPWRCLECDHPWDMSLLK
jgi:hypothetical protein